MAMGFFFNRLSLYMLGALIGFFARPSLLLVLVCHAVVPHVPLVVRTWAVKGSIRKAGARSVLNLAPAWEDPEAEGMGVNRNCLR